MGSRRPNLSYLSAHPPPRPHLLSSFLMSQKKKTWGARWWAGALQRHPHVSSVEKTRECPQILSQDHLPSFSSDDSSAILGLLPQWPSGKESACQCRRRDAGWIPGSGGSPEKRNGNPLRYSCLENPTDRGVTVNGMARSRNDLGTKEQTAAKLSPSAGRPGPSPCFQSLLSVLGLAGPGPELEMRSDPKTKKHVLWGHSAKVPT